VQAAQCMCQSAGSDGPTRMQWCGVHACREPALMEPLLQDASAALLAGVWAGAIKRTAGGACDVREVSCG
jgi:hypothetical protein